MKNSHQEADTRVVRVSKQGQANLKLNKLLSEVCLSPLLLHVYGKKKECPSPLAYVCKLISWEQPRWTKRKCGSLPKEKERDSGNKFSSSMKLVSHNIY